MLEIYEKIWETCKPRGEFKHRYWCFAGSPNIARNCRNLLLSSDSYRLLKYRRGCTKPLFQLSVWCENCVAARHYVVICKQLLISNERSRVRSDGAFTDLLENLSVNSLKGDLSNAITFIPPLFSLVNTFKYIWGNHSRMTLHPILSKYFPTCKGKFPSTIYIWTRNCCSYSTGALSYNIISFVRSTWKPTKNKSGRVIKCIWPII